MPKTLWYRFSSALDPNLMTAAERLAEIGEILAAGILRLRASWLSPLSVCTLTGLRWLTFA
jgi:hypothetical protein